MPGLRDAFVLLVSMAGWAANAGAVAPSPLTIGVKEALLADAKQVSLDQYRADLNGKNALLADCRQRATACDAARVGNDLEVSGGGTSFRAGYDWLRFTLADARKLNDPDRASLMEKAATRLQEDAVEAGAATAPDTVTPGARNKAEAILSRPEFRVVNQDNWLFRQWRMLLARIADGIERAASRIPHSSSLVLVIEWGLLSLAAAGLLIWAWRSMRQQRLLVSAPSEARQAVWQKESDDWARLAEVEAAAGRWRDAVHCLYWAAIVMLEGRRMWRANRARTPREYIPLLENGSPRQAALGGLTRIFERVWYGLRPAGRVDFERAQALVNELKAT